MKDLPGFFIVVFISIFLLYLLLEFLFPFVLTYLLGTLAFFFTANAIVRRNRLHPVHLDCLLKKHVPLLLLVLSLAIPLVHALGVWILGRHSGWYIIGLANLIFPLMWSFRMLFAHRRQKQQYYAEAHDIEDLLSEIISRNTALGIRALEVQSALATPRVVQSWERVGNSNTQVATPICSETLLEQLQNLKGEYAHLQQRVQLLLNTSRATGTRPDKSVMTALKKNLQTMEERYQKACSQARQLVADCFSDIWTGLYEFR